MEAETVYLYSYNALLVTQTLHLLHHRLAKRHISFAEVVSSVLLCGRFFVTQALWWPLGILQSAMIVIQIVGSLFIKRLSPDWQTTRDEMK